MDREHEYDKTAGRPAGFRVGILLDLETAQIEGFERRGQEYDREKW